MIRGQFSDPGAGNDGLSAGDWEGGYEACRSAGEAEIEEELARLKAKRLHARPAQEHATIGPRIEQAKRECVPERQRLDWCHF